MMKLYAAPASPFVRKVRIVALEVGVTLDILNIGAVAPEVAVANPLSKIPTLVLDDGGALFDSPVICEFLNDLGQGDLLPPAGPDRWRALRLEALADGVCDSAVWRRGEGARPVDDQHLDAIAKQAALVQRALDALEADPPAAEFKIGEIAVACALGYLDFRFAHEAWRDGRPKLTAWFAATADRASFKATDPSAA